ncbi:MAG: tRNA (adenosine(37)-N6)-threonylcarbamoyltransferase complex dimerization subunit type 1 TsaB [Faecalibacterium sp.]
MNILAVDTAGKTAGVALLQDDRLRYECYLDAGMTHSETLMPLIDTCLRLCGMRCSDIDVYGVNAGPGSFTGLRIGLATVKGLAFPRETPCAPVSTLEALAAAHIGEGTVLCALDARRAQVYCAAFDLATHTRLLEDDARAVDDLEQFVKTCKKPVFFVGDGASLCYNKYGQLPGVLPVPPALRGGRAAAVAFVAKQMAEDGRTVLPEALLPDYHRLSQAERERAQRLAAETAAGKAANTPVTNGKDQTS